MHPLTTVMCYGLLPIIGNRRLGCQWIRLSESSECFANRLERVMVHCDYNMYVVLQKSS